MTCLGTLFVVVPPASVHTMHLRCQSSRLSVQVLDECSLVPDMRSFFYLPGWYKQQLIKLAAAEVMTTEYYLTLDADVVCTRSVGYDDLLPGGRARCFVMQQDDHANWYQGAEAVLNLQAPQRHILHNVTPCMCSRLGVLELIAHLNDVAKQHPYARGIRGLQQRSFYTLHRIGPHRGRSPWRAWLSASRPWAEYATYFTFLEAKQRFNTYHFYSQQCIYDVKRSIWYSRSSLSDLDLDALFEGSGPPYFLVVQSNTGIDAAKTWERLAARLQPRVVGDP